MKLKRLPWNPHSTDRREELPEAVTLLGPGYPAQETKEMLAISVSFPT